MGSGLTADSRWPSTAAAQLDGRILLHARDSDLGTVADLIDSEHSGIVITLGRARRMHGRARLPDVFRDHRYRPPVLIDTEAHLHATATVDNPFELGADISDDALIEHLDGQIGSGATVAVTPTRLIPTRSFDVLYEVLRRTTELKRTDTLCLLPLDSGWLGPTPCKYLDDALRHARVPVALILKKSMDLADPHLLRGGYPETEARNRFQELLTNYPGLCLLRTDLAAFDVISRGGRLTSIGIRAKLRAAGGPDAGYRSRDVPRVLVPELLRWLNAGSVAHATGHGSPVACPCNVCGGELLRRFDHRDRATHIEAERHNIATWMAWAIELAEIGSPARRLWWRSKCLQALDAADRWRHVPDRHFPDSPQLRFWSED